MKKKLIVALIAALLVVSFVCAGASAASRREINKLYDKVDCANVQIMICVIKAQITPYDDVAWLLRKVDNIVKPVFLYADKIGCTIACEYDYYWIDGRYVAIDPLRVVNVGTGTKK